MSEEFEVDISPRELIALLRADQKERAPALWASASKSREKRDIESDAARVALDDDVAETVTRGLLEVRLRHGGGWALRVNAEDAAEEHRAEEEEDEEKTEELTLDAFEEEFLTPEGRLADVTVSVENAEAKARFDRWLSGTLTHA